MRWSIFDSGLVKAKTAEAEARTRQARLRVSQLEEQITLEVREALINLQNALARVVVADRAEKSAQSSLDVARDLLKNGMARHSEVLDAYARLTDTQYEAMVARDDVMLARASLEHAVGLSEKQGKLPKGDNASASR